jgi:hypothetical protein
VDWTVVRVVVMERTDGAGEEKVLLPPPSVRGAVALVPAPEGATSDIAVSAVVARVGGRDLPGSWLSRDGENDLLLCVKELCRDRSGSLGSEKARWPFCDSMRPDSGYGLFFEAAL